MTTPTYTFLQRDAALPGEPKKFCDALIATGRFYRNEHSVVKLKLAEGDFALVENKRTLREILISGEVIDLRGDINDNAMDILWMWFVSRRWTFPRLNPERPYSPPKPLPVTRTGAAFVRHSDQVRK